MILDHFEYLCQLKKKEDKGRCKIALYNLIDFSLGIASLAAWQFLGSREHLQTPAAALSPAALWTLPELIVTVT